jgi:hypothetical protein
VHDPFTPVPITDPADLDAATERELVDAWSAHARQVARARHGIGEPTPPALLAGHALGALATEQELTDRLVCMRWVTTRDALAYGAPLSRVAAALRLEPAEVASELRAWADDHHEHAGMSAAARGEVYALVERAVDAEVCAALGIANPSDADGVRGAAGR